MTLRSPSLRQTALASILTAVLALPIIALAGHPAAAQQVGAAEEPDPVLTVSPGELVIDPPTLINLGFEWLIEGDHNRNARVDVSYRAVGESE